MMPNHLDFFYVDGICHRCVVQALTVGTWNTFQWTGRRRWRWQCSRPFHHFRTPGLGWQLWEGGLVGHTNSHGMRAPWPQPYPCMVQHDGAPLPGMADVSPIKMCGSGRETLILTYSSGTWAPRTTTFHNRSYLVVAWATVEVCTGARKVTTRRPPPPHSLSSFPLPPSVVCWRLEDISIFLFCIFSLLLM